MPEAGDPSESADDTDVKGTHIKRTKGKFTMNTRTAKSLAALAAVTLIATLTGCSTGTGDDVDAPIAGCEDAPAKIGYSPLTMELAWFTIFERGLRAAAEACGTEVIVADPGGDAIKQASDIDTLVASGVEALAIYAVDPITIAASVAAAKEAGIAIVGVASEFDGATTVGIDFRSTGYSSGVCGGEWLEANDAKDAPYKIAILHGKSTGQNQIDQYDGMIDGLTEVVGADGFEVVAEADVFTEEKGFTDVTAILQANPQLDLIITNNDGGALGALSAVSSAGFEVGVDVGVAAAGIDERLLDEVAAGRAVCSVDSAPDMLGEAVYETATDLVNGVDAEPFEVAGDAITADNVKEIATRLYGE